MGQIEWPGRCVRPSIHSTVRMSEIDEADRWDRKFEQIDGEIDGADR